MAKKKKKKKKESLMYAVKEIAKYFKGLKKELIKNNEFYKQLYLQEM